MVSSTWWGRVVGSRVELAKVALCPHDEAHMKGVKKKTCCTMRTSTFDRACFAFFHPQNARACVIIPIQKCVVVLKSHLQPTRKNAVGS